MSLFVFIILVFAAACSGALFPPGPWYEELDKPSWTPANWVFPVVWTPLYAMIAAAGWIVWQEAGWSLAIIIWILQLVANGAWSWLFFGIRRMDLAIFDLGLMWLAIVAFIILAWPISNLAAMLFVPYLVWVTIAGLLNYSVLRLNAEALSRSR